MSKELFATKQTSNPRKSNIDSNAQLADYSIQTNQYGNAGDKKAKKVEAEKFNP